MNQRKDIKCNRFANRWGRKGNTIEFRNIVVKGCRKGVKFAASVGQIQLTDVVR